MSVKTILIICAQALLVQYVLSQCTSRAAIDASGPYGLTGPAIAPLAYDGLAAPFAYDGFGAAPCGNAGSLAYDGYRAPFAYDGIGAPSAYDATPFGCDGYRAPLAYNGYAAPFANDGLAGFGARGFAYDGLYTPTMDFTPTSGGGLTVTSASAIPPTGISVISENAYEGVLVVAGEVPFVGTTGMEGVLPTTGSGAVNHACGTGINAMVSETTAFVPGYAGSTIESAAFAPAYGAAIIPAAAIAPAYGTTIAPAAAIAPAAIFPAAYTGCGRGIVY